jgi:site-specific recombinase XerD
VGLSQAAAAAVAAGVPEETRRAYAGDWKRFSQWCAQSGRSALPASAETVTEYATHLAYTLGRRPCTVERALAAVRVMHRTAGAELPELIGARKVIGGWATELATRKNDPRAAPRRATPAVPASLRLMVGTLDVGTVAGARDVCLLVLGFALAARRSELAAVDLEDVAETEEGLDVGIYRGKNKKLQQVAVPYGSFAVTCPVRTFQRWRGVLAEHERTTGPLLVRIDRHGHLAVPMTRNGQPIGDPDGRMTGQAIAAVVNRTAAAAGLIPPAEPDRPNAAPPRWSGHSLRRGFATAARKAGHDLVRVGRHGGWADGSKSLLAYFEDADRWLENPLVGVGL